MPKAEQQAIEYLEKLLVNARKHPLKCIMELNIFQATPE